MLTTSDLLHDPSFPYWGKAVVRTALTRDPTDAINVLETIAHALNNELRERFEHETTPSK